MRIIIDAYNVLKPLSPAADVSDRKRESFIEQVAQYACERGNQATLVFDGGGYERPTRFKHRGILVIYSGYRDSADDVIKKILDGPHRDDLLLVSTDRDICAHAERLGVASMDSSVFYGHMLDHDEEIDSCRHPKQASGLHKRPGHDSTPDLDALMQQASSMMIPHSDRDDEYSAENHKNKGKKKKLSKAEKRLQKIVKKL